MIVCLMICPPSNFKDNFTVRHSLEDFSYYEVILEQMDRIGPLDYPFNMHESKMEVRILMPLILRFIYPFDPQYLPFFIYALNIIALFAFSVELNRFQKVHLPGVKPGFLLSLCFGTIYTGVSFVMDYWPMFDGMVFLLVMIAINQKDSRVATFLLFLSLFVDERALFPSFMALSFLHGERMKPFVWNAFLLLLLYFGARVFLHLQYGLRSPFSKTEDLRLFGYVNQDRVHLFTIAFANCFKTLWILPILSIVLFMRRKDVGLVRYLQYTIILLCFLGSAFAAFSVNDFTRSLSYGFPFFLFSMKFCYERFSDLSPLKGAGEHVRNGVFSTFMGFLIMSNIINETHLYHSSESIFSTVDIFSRLGARLVKYLAGSH